MFHPKFAKNIKKKYRDRLINREQQWPYYHGEKLISLDLIEGERDQKKLCLRESDHHLKRYSQRENVKTQLKRTPIGYVDIFKAKGKMKSVRKVLVEGDAGIGKTTLCTTISEDWANDKLFQQFQLLLLLPLREREVAKASSLHDLLSLFYPSEDLRTSVASFIEDKEGENTLIVADGWDELGVAERNEETFLYKLLFGKIFVFMSVLVTSRYSASASLHNLPHIDRFIEIRGFNKESIADFIESEFSNDRIVGRNLLKKLENSPLIGSVCSVPLCCVIICHLWRTLQEDMPATMTDLYTKITLNILIRNVRKSLPECKDVMSCSSLDSLPEELKQSWNLLCEFAFLTITKDQIVFSQKEIVDIWPHGSTIDENIFHFGLLQSAQSLFAVGKGMSFHFLHLTFQEFLAALYLSRQPFETQVQVCNQYANILRFDMVIRFLFGITAQTPDSEEAVEKLLTSIRHSCAPWTICHSLFEASHTNLTSVENVCKKLFRFLYLPDYITRTAHHVSAFIHVLTYTHIDCIMNINFESCGPTSNQISAFGQALAAKKGRVQIQRLNLSRNQLTDEVICTLFSSETVLAFKTLSHLMIDCNEVGAKGLESVMSTVKSAQLSGCYLTTLCLSHNPLGISGVQVLEHTICSGAFISLEYLSVRGCLTDDADTNATLLISLSASLSFHCPIMSRLDVSENNLGLPGTRALGTVVSQLSQHENDSEILLQFADTNFHCRPSFYNIQNISFTCYKYQSVSIDLSDNPIGLNGVIAIGHMISKNQISAIFLNRCQLTCSTTSPLIEVQSSNNNFYQTCNSVSSIGWQLFTIQPSSTLTELDLCGNDLSGKSIDILAGFMHLCPLLYDLRCTSCEINSHDLKNLFIRLDDMKSRSMFMGKLVSWWLYENKIDDSGVSTLIEHLPSLFPNLKGVYFDSEVESNLISRQMRLKLNEALNQVQTATLT